jgi:carbon monoxide dehydrogenase subunit G
MASKSIDIFGGDEMKLEVEVRINASKEKVWGIIADIENSINTIAGIEKIEILEKPETGLVGLKWRETRTLFGKTATEVMWITEVEDQSFYKTRAESHGMVYLTTMAVEPAGVETRLSMAFEGIPQTFAGKLMSATMGRFMANATKKALQKDLEDIKNAVEKPA